MLDIIVPNHNNQNRNALIINAELDKAPDPTWPNVLMDIEVSRANGSNEAELVLRGKIVGRLFNGVTGSSGRRTVRVVMDGENFQEGANFVVVRKPSGVEPRADSGFSIHNIDQLRLTKITPQNILLDAEEPEPAPAPAPAPATSNNFDLLIDAVSNYHEGRDALDVPLSFRFGQAPYPSLPLATISNGRNRSLDQDQRAQDSDFNAWNHVTIDYKEGTPPSSLRVEMGHLCVAILRKSTGKWVELCKVPGRGRIFPFGTPGVQLHKGDDVINVIDSNRSQVGRGYNGWNNTKDESHGHLWPINAFIRGFTGSDIEAVIVWGSAKLVGAGPEGLYYYRVGSDGREPGEKGALRALCHGRMRRVKRNKEYFFASDRSPATLRALRNANNLPPSFPG